MKKNVFLNIIICLLSSVFCLALVFYVYRVWEIDFSVPPLYEGDGMLGMLLATSIDESGIVGNFFIDRLGAPGISAVVDTSFIDLIALVQMYIISLLTNSAAAINYWFYFLSFPFACISMYILLLKMTKRKIYRCIFSILFAITPYHFNRGYLHASLSNCFIVPIAIYLAFLIVDEEFSGLFPIRYKNKRIKKIAMVLACLMLGCSNIYYAFIGLICIFLAVIFKAFREKKISIFYNEGLMVALSLIGVVIGLLPTIIYQMAYGPNTVSGVRDPAQTEFYSLKLIQMLLPCSYNRVNLLQNIYERYSDNAYIVNENSYSSLGGITTIGFIFACIWVIYKIASSICVANSHVEMGISTSDTKRYDFIGLLILVLILYASSGGFGTIFSYVINPVFRSINRVSIFIVCLALCLLAITIDKVDRRVNKNEKIIIYILMGGLLFYSLYAEVPYCTEGYQKDNVEYNNFLKDYFGQIENDLLPGDMVYNAPYIDFPEGVILNNMTGYEPAYGYVYTKDIRWSFGGIAGRNDAAKLLFIDDGFGDTFLKQIISNGFSAICIDRLGYEDFGNEAINYYSDILCLKPIVSDNDRFYYYNLKSVDVSNLNVVY